VNKGVAAICHGNSKLAEGHGSQAKLRRRFLRLSFWFTSGQYGPLKVLFLLCLIDSLSLQFELRTAMTGEYPVLLPFSKIGPSCRMQDYKSQHA